MLGPLRQALRRCLCLFAFGSVRPVSCRMHDGDYDYGKGPPTGIVIVVVILVVWRGCASCHPRLPTYLQLSSKSCWALNPSKCTHATLQAFCCHRHHSSSYSSREMLCWSCFLAGAGSRTHAGVVVDDPPDAGVGKLTSSARAANVDDACSANSHRRHRRCRPRRCRRRRRRRAASIFVIVVT